MPIRTPGFVLHSAKLGLHDKGGQKGGGTFDIVSPTLQKVGGHVPLSPPLIDAHVLSNVNFEKGVILTQTTKGCRPEVF